MVEAPITGVGVPLVDAAALETHMSVLFFFGDKVFKVRKPVNYGFADFRDVAERGADCRREVRLNRRLSADVYVGTARIALSGRTAEHAVVMRRLPASRNLASMIADGQDVDTELEQIAEVLAGFHRRARRSRRIAMSSTAESIWQRWQATEEVLGRFIGTAFDASEYRRLVTLADRFLRGRRSLFDRRVAAGAVCDGHGDLQAADVFCMPDGPRILDCLEFDEQLRHGDVLADAAFLVQDLERMGADHEAHVFIDTYRKATGADHPGSLLDFYVAARAHVRLLVECIRIEQGLDALPSDPETVLAQALSHLERAIPRLVLVGGMPGTGKSSLAAWVGEELGATVLSSDRERAEGTSRSLGPAAFGTGPYTFAKRREVYDRLLERASALLSEGVSVVVDATWSNREFRRRAAATAAATCTELVELECRCDPALRSERISRRDRHPLRGESDATPDVADALAAVADPWPGAHTVDTSGTVEASRTAALAALRSEGWAGRN